VRVLIYTFPSTIFLQITQIDDNFTRRTTPLTNSPLISQEMEDYSINALLERVKEFQKR
jgi:hypothetical protein